MRGAMKRRFRGVSAVVGGGSILIVAFSLWMLIAAASYWSAVSNNSRSLTWTWGVIGCLCGCANGAYAVLWEEGDNRHPIQFLITLLALNYAMLLCAISATPEMFRHPLSALEILSILVLFAIPTTCASVFLIHLSKRTPAWRWALLVMCVGLIAVLSKRNL